MTVEQLIKELSKYYPQTKVVTCGYEEGYNDIKDIMVIKMIPNPGKISKDRYWEGDYDFSVDKNAETAILIPR